MAPVPDGASELPRSNPKTASRKRFAWRLYPFTTTSPTWATITALNAPATGPSKPPRTPLINSPASFIISLKLVKTRHPYDETVFAKLEARNQKHRLHKLQTLARQMGYSLVQANA